MEIDVAFFARDAHIVAQELYVWGGGLDVLLAPAFPTEVGPLMLVARLRVPPAQCQQTHAVQVTVCDPHGAALLTSTGAVAVPPPTLDPGLPVLVPLVIDVPPVAVRQPGDYGGQIRVGGHLLKTVRLAGRPLPVAAPVPPTHLN